VSIQLFLSFFFRTNDDIEGTALSASRTALMPGEGASHI